MMQYLKQSTSVTLKIGPFLDSTDGVTPETGLTISQSDVRLTKNGGNFAQKNDAAAATHDENGWYDCDLDATDTNTLGRLTLAVNESGALPVWFEFTVLAANVFDSLVGATDNLQVDTTQVEGLDATDQIGDATADEVYEGTLTLRQMMRILLSAMAGETNGSGTLTVNFRDVADSKNRITATIDGNGNRTAIVLTGT